MRKFKPAFLYLIGALVMVIAGTVYEKSFLGSKNFKSHVKRFQATLNKKELLLDSLLNKIRADTAGSEIRNSAFINPEYLEMLRDEGLALFIYENDKIKTWSDNSFPFPQYYSDSLFRDSLVFLGNTLFKPLVINDGNRKYVGLIKLKREFPYENNWLTNDYQKHFGLPSSVGLVKVDSTGLDRSNLIYDRNGRAIARLDFSQWNYNPVKRYVNSGFYFVGLVLLLLFFGKCLVRLQSVRHKKWALLILAVILCVMNYILVTLRIPASVYSTELLSPYYFANSYLLGSIGEFFITSLFIFFFITMFSREYSFREILNERPFVFRFLATLIVFLFGAFCFAVSHYLFRNVLMNSSISMEPYKVLDLSIYSIIGFTGISLIFISFVLLIIKIGNLVNQVIDLKYLYICLFFSLSVFPLLSVLTDYTVDFVAILFYVIMAIIGLHVKKDIQPPYSYILLFVFLLATFSLYVIITETAIKEKDTRKVLAVNLGVEHDPVAEMLLEEVSQDLLEDQVLIEHMQKGLFSIEEWQEIYQYLRDNYFTGYWEKYDLRHTICNDTSGILVNDMIVTHCFTFFQDSVAALGNPLPNSRFYFLDNQTGSISYYGSFEFPIAQNRYKNVLFIELDSRLIYEQLGYPELLLDKKLLKRSPLDRYSYAKYLNRELITQSGDFPYGLSCDVYSQSGDEFSFFNNDGFNHLMYHVNPQNSIIISKPELRVIDVLTSFSYLFVFLYLLMSVVLILVYWPYYKRSRQINFKFKIELSLISILLLTILMIGGGAVYFSIKQYESKHYENLSEKTRSVYIELEHKLIEETELTPEWYSDQYASLHDLLLKFSNVFYSDINLYDAEGRLLATSRPEIFEKNLLGSNMDIEAFRQLTVNKKAEYVHNEFIGKLKYLSAYVPFVNRDNNLLAYLNLPYFTKQNLLAKEISNLVVAIVNFSVVLILLTITIAVIISGKITNPLRLIQRKLGNIELGKPAEHIHYEGQDEIGNLVGEYNRMVDELAKSVQLIARSERESAWREMAKQIAHEIKNPLTPMKLSIQQLQKAWEDEKQDWQENLKGFSQTLIDQIDNLSTIATAFSDFARMPRTKNEVINIVAKINNSVSLFNNTQNVDFQIDLHGYKRVYVFADKEQLIRVFSNLFKNAIQSIPSYRKGIIRIDLSTEEERVIIRISDNGQGIPEELREKLFIPNFTTKSSGMGLGLAIVKNIVEDANGSISYRTKIGEGSTFILEFPLRREDE
ncbi:MAG: GHKL domain-containing protein [Bacteroidales bacterium]|nr:MAG: GHKL domain-containing protein [Bacteroidales bacterium]